jgi:hypothetical protein
MAQTAVIYPIKTHCPASYEISFHPIGSSSCIVIALGYHERIRKVETALGVAGTEISWTMKIWFWSWYVQTSKAFF